MHWKREGKKGDFLQHFLRAYKNQNTDWWRKEGRWCGPFISHKRGCTEGWINCKSPSSGVEQQHPGSGGGRGESGKQVMSFPRFYAHPPPYFDFNSSHSILSSIWSVLREREAITDTDPTRIVCGKWAQKESTLYRKEGVLSYLLGNIEESQSSRFTQREQRTVNSEKSVPASKVNPT